MNQPPFQLKDYFYPIISILANPDHEPGKPVDMELSFQSVIAEPRAEGGLYQVQLDIDGEAENSVNAPYQIAIQMVGHFEMTDDLGDRDPITSLAYAGLSLLYGAAREMVYTNTARGPWESYILPTVRPDVLFENLKVASIKGKSSPSDNRVVKKKVARKSAVKKSATSKASK